MISLSSSNSNGSMAGASSDSVDRPTAAALTAKFDRPLHALGFEYSQISPEKVTGRLTVSESWCQPFKRMHGGVAAFVAEGVASAGAVVASGFKRVAGIQLSINHIRPAFLGDQVDVEATRLLLGTAIQVWDVQQWMTNPATGEKVLISSSKVTLRNLQSSYEATKSLEEAMKKKYAKL